MTLTEEAKRRQGEQKTTPKTKDSKDGKNSNRKKAKK